MLVSTENVLAKKVSVTGWSKDSVTISDLTKAEIEAVEGSMNGQSWIKGNKAGRLEIVPASSPLPDPVERRADASVLEKITG